MSQLLPDPHVLVDILPLGDAIQVPTGASLMATASLAGLVWPTVCHGEGWCAVCVVKVLRGSECFSAPNDWERENLGKIIRRSNLDDELRLACQMRATSGAAVIEKVGVKRA